MKGEYVDERDNPHNPNTRLPPDMLSKLQQQQQKAPVHHPHPHLQHHFSDSKKPKTSDEAGGETVEAVRRPRGRPPGSKNKPKAGMVITREGEGEGEAPSMSPYILEIPSGADVVESLVGLTRRRRIGLCVLSASGAVANATLRQQPSGGGSIVFHGRFDLASVSAVILPGGDILGGGGGFTITLSAPQGHIVGGKVVGPLLAAGTVYVVASSFNNPTFHKLPLGLGDDHNGGDQLSSPTLSGTAGGLIYTCQPDVIWAPTPRPSPPPY